MCSKEDDEKEEANTGEDDSVEAKALKDLAALMGQMQVHDNEKAEESKEEKKE